MGGSRIGGYRIASWCRGCRVFGRGSKTGEGRP